MQPERRRAILLVIFELALFVGLCTFSSCVTYHLMKPDETADWRRLPRRTR